MNDMQERLAALCVGDAMSVGVVTVSANATMAEAAEVLCKNSIGGLPVVDEKGRCVGILTTTDFAARNDRLESLGESSGRERDYSVVGGSLSNPVHIEFTGEDHVKQYMTTAVQSVEEQSSLMTAGRIMRDQHVHRLVVLNGSSRPIGVITSLDFVAAVVQTMEE